MPYKEKSSNLRGNNREKVRSSLLDIGEKNVGNWEALKRRLNFSSNPDFVEYLLLLAEKYLSNSPNSVTHNYNRWDKNDSVVTEFGKTESCKDDVDVITHQNDRLLEDKNHSEVTLGHEDVPTPQEDNEAIRQKSTDKFKEERKKIDEDQSEDGIEVVENEDSEVTRRNRKNKFRAAKKRKVRGTDPLIADGDNKADSKTTGKPEEHKIEDWCEKSVSTPGTKVCQYCDTNHPKDSCPLFHPSSTINDSCIFSSGTKVDHATASLPGILEMREKDAKGTLGIFARVHIGKYTQFGPLVGVSIKEMEIADDSPMKHIWEVTEGTYLSTSDPEKSNWIRWLCPAPTRHDRNVVPLEREGKLYFVTTTPIESGSEIFFWAEMNGPWASKKMERTSCGGCNLQFEHAMYYRTHCAVFHEASLSLTVRKYHCKVCGKAVLGKQNIMKHALLYHEGKGAYQCQFCSKFFLRLNYLEMHRNYGCSANPHRARPLCDYCGRKFCQPQKLKVHIKRMHSDLAEVLHEFQCRDCLKILGSRAALQRHTKEVHKRPSGVSCAKCSKTFQNKSNLKIHMLTHSGVKPFQCQEGRCSAAFTTKQCLQFHYKKVHGLSEDRFPSIVRSVEYTFESYAGVRDAALDGRDVDDNQDTSDSLQLDNGGESSAEENRSSRLIVVDGEDDTNPSTGPTCEETSVIEYHSSTTVNKEQDLGETKQLTGNASRGNVTGVIMSGQSSASLLVEAALESAENDLCRSLPAPSPPPPPLLPSDLPVSEVSPEERHMPEIVIPSYGELRRSSPTPHYVSVMYDGVRASSPPITSPQVTYLSPRYERHYLSPPPTQEFLHEEQRYHEDEMAQNLTKYKYEEARVMYHELIPRYPIAAADYYPWEVLRPALNLQTSVDLSASAGHLPPAMERPPSPPYQSFHVPQKSPVFHHYTSYY